MFASALNTTLNFVKDSTYPMDRILAHGRKTVGDLVVGTVIGQAAMGALLATAGGVQAIKAFSRGDFKRGAILSAAALTTAAIAAGTLYVSYNVAYQDRINEIKIARAKEAETLKNQFDDTMNCFGCPFEGELRTPHEYLFPGQSYAYARDIVSTALASVSDGYCIPQRVTQRMVNCEEIGSITRCSIDPSFDTVLNYCNPNTYKHNS